MTKQVKKMSRLHQDNLEEKVSLVSEISILLEVRAFEQKKGYTIQV